MQVSKRIRRATIKEASRILALSEYEVRRRVKNGKIPHIKCGNKYLVDIVLATRILEREAYGNLNEDYYDSEDNIIHFSGVQAMN